MKFFFWELKIQIFLLKRERIKNEENDYCFLDGFLCYFYDF